MRERGLSEVVHVIKGLSTNVTLPERADLLVHEILGEIASIEGVYVTYANSHTYVHIHVYARARVCTCI